MKYFLGFVGIAKKLTPIKARPNINAPKMNSIVIIKIPYKGVMAKV